MEFAAQLALHIKDSGLSLRQIGGQAGIPYQTLHNWLKGSRPRPYAHLPRDLRRLGLSLRLNEPEITRLLRLAGCGAANHSQEDRVNNLRIPKGWTWGGDAPQKYEMGIDPEVTYQGRACVTIKALPDPLDFGALVQTFKAEPYRGRRLRFSAMVRAEAVEQMAALWMRVGAADDRMLAFDNMRNRPITGSSDWSEYAVVLDVAAEAETVGFGVFLSLGGQVWMADVRLEPVDLSVSTTDQLGEVLHETPANLDFSE
jgi:hypothetical protein